MIFRLEGSDLHLWDDGAEHVVPCRGVCCAAARLGALSVLHWLRPQGNSCTSKSTLCIFAAAGGSVDVLRWLGSPHLNWSEATCEAACQGGSLPTLKWLRRNGCPWDKTSGEAAVKRRDLEMLTWLRHNGAPIFTKMFAQTAAYHGDLPTLRWLHQAGCPYGAGVLKAAAGRGHPEILQWAQQEVVPPLPWTYRVAYHAVERSQRRCLEVAIAHGCPWWPFHDAPAFPCDNILMCCYELRAPLPQYALRRVAQKVLVSVTLCLVKTRVALPAPIASDIAKMVYHELLTT